MSSLVETARSLLTPERIRTLVRFVVMGLVSTATYFLTALGATRLGASVEHAHIIGLGISLAVSYYGQKVFTFRIDGNHKRHGPRFLIATGIIILMQFILVIALKQLGLTPVWIFLTSSAFYPVASLIIHWSWTFRAEPE